MDIHSQFRIVHGPGLHLNDIASGDGNSTNSTIRMFDPDRTANCLTIRILIEVQDHVLHTALIGANLIDAGDLLLSQGIYT